MLKLEDRLWVEKVRGAVLAPLEFATGSKTLVDQFNAGSVRIGGAMTRSVFGSNNIETDTTVDGLDADDSTYRALSLILEAWDEGTESGVPNEQMAYAAMFTRPTNNPLPGPLMLGPESFSIEVQSRMPDGTGRRTINVFRLGADGLVARMDSYRQG